MRLPQLSHRLWLFAKARLYSHNWNRDNAARIRQRKGQSRQPWKGRQSIDPVIAKATRLARIAKWCRTGRTLHCMLICGTKPPMPDTLALEGEEPWVFDDTDLGWAPSMEAGHVGQLAAAASVALFDAYDDVHGDIMLVTDDMKGQKTAHCEGDYWPNGKPGAK